MPWRFITRLRPKRLPFQETQNAQIEDEIGRQEALPVHRQWQGQARPDAQAPRYDQALERADPRASRDAGHVRVRDPAHQALDALRELKGSTPCPKPPAPS